MDMQLHQKQTQTLSPQMLQAMEILQMGTQELAEFIQETLQENPTLESDERGQLPSAPEQNRGGIVSPASQAGLAGGHGLPK